MQTPKSTPAVDYPQALTAEPLALACSFLCRTPRDLPNFFQDTLSGLIPSATRSLTCLSQLGRGLVTISHELAGVTPQLPNLSEDNEALKEELQISPDK